MASHDVSFIRISTYIYDRQTRCSAVFHLKPSQRRQGLVPNWSWAGWHGSIKYRGKGWQNAFAFKPISVVTWLESIDAFEALQRLGHSMTEEQRQVFKEGMQLHGSNFTARVDVGSDAWSNAADRWNVFTKSSTNQILCLHDQYPHRVFEDPIPLPGQKVFKLPDKHGALHFRTYVVSAKFCDMRTTSFIQKAGQNQFLQIGLYDSERSANFRASSHRIIYHQGYRAGFLFLDLSSEELDLAASSYRLVALSRDDLPVIHGSAVHESYLESMLPIMYKGKLEFERGVLDQSNLCPPNEDVEPDTDPQPENGDPHWDAKRFVIPLPYSIYNVLFVQVMGKYMTRLGVGKAVWHAIHHAGAEKQIVELR